MGPQSPLLRMSSLRYRFRESLFQLPALIVLGGIVLAEITARLDEHWGDATDTPVTLSINSHAATWLLSTLAGAMITTAGVVFSLTVVSLQLASSQFSPRVMRSFVRDRLSQVVIGLLVATFVFCVLTLRHVEADADAPAPAITLTAAVVLSVTTVLLIIAHLNHLAGRLQVGEVVRAILEEGETTVDAMDRATRHEQRWTGEPPNPHDGGEPLVVPAARGGWVTQSSSAEMFAAVPPGSTIRLETRTGAYIHAGEPLITVTPCPDRPERVARALAATVDVADTRTMQQDVDFALRQLVDVGLRALSPAINDPNTAVEVVLRVGGLLRRLLLADLPLSAVAGPDDKVLLRPWELDHEEYLDHGLDQLRQCAISQPQVVAALLRTFRMLKDHVTANGREDLVPALDRQHRRLTEAVRHAGLHPDDRDDLLEIAESRTDPADHERRTD